MKTPEGTNVPMRIALDKMRRASDERQFQLLAQEAQLQDTMREMAVPDGFGQMLGAYIQAIKQMAFPGGAPGGPPRDPAAYRAEMLEYAAYRWSGLYIERPPDGGLVLHDFEEYVRCAVRIHFAGSETGAVYVISPDNEFTLHGETVHAFLKYLHFIGMFAAIDARIPCPNCEPGKVNKDCTNCDGLGWTVDDPASARMVVEP